MLVLQWKPKCLLQYLHIGYIHKWSTIVYWRLKQINKMQYCNTLAISTYVCQLLNQFWGFHFDIWYIPKYWAIKCFLFLKKKKNNVFQVFNIFENNIISVQLTKVLQYPYCHMEMKTNAPCNTTTLIFSCHSFFFNIIIIIFFFQILLLNIFFWWEISPCYKLFWENFKKKFTRFLFLEKKK
jgi:hypothetical protein